MAKLRQRYRRSTLSRRFLLIYCLAGILPLLVTNAYASTVLNANTRDSQMLAAQMSYEQTFSYLSDKLYRILRMCDVIALDATLQECLYGHDADDYPIPQQIADRSKIITFLTKQKDDLDIYNINLYVRDDWIYSGSSSMIYGLNSAQGQLWIERLRSIRYQALFCPPSYLPENDMLAVARRVRNLDNLDHFDAVLRIDFPLDEMQRILLSGCTVQGATSVLINDQGEFVASSSGEMPPIASLKTLIDDADLQQSFLRSQQNPDQWVQCLRIPHTDWLLLTVLSQSAMSQVSRRAWIGVIVLLLLVTAPALIASRFMVRSMTDRLHTLDVHMQNVRGGRLEPTRDDPNEDEIGRMTVSYNFMIERIRTLIEQQFEMGRSMRSTELLALQSQINPHFLYNTLDMLNWMSRLENNDAVQDILQALADFYRFTLSNGDDIVALETELHIIDSYMKIQCYRFGEDIELVVDVSPEAARLSIPKLTLQPLIENALVHGIMPKQSGKGTIYVRGRIDGETLLLEVEDDGVGTPPEHIQSIARIKATPQRRSGYGLYNINERLSLYYGATQCLSVRSAPGGGTVICIRVPIRRL